MPDTSFHSYSTADNPSKLDEVNSKAKVDTALLIPREVYVILESIAELPPPNWRELVIMTNDPATAFAAVIYASPSITGELARLVLEHGLIKPQNSELN